MSRSAWLAAAIILAGTGFLYFRKSTTGKGLEDFMPYTEAAWDQAKAAGSPVVVLATADW